LGNWLVSTAFGNIQFSVTEWNLSHPTFWYIRGEDGYMRVAQTEKGSYGLFGMLAEGVIVDAYNVTAQVYDEEQQAPLTWWMILLVVLACLCCCCVCFAMFKKMRKVEKE
jgi:hypothetical protein